MSQQLHLHTGVFRVHRLDVETLGTDNLDVLVFLHLFVDVFFLEIRRRLLLVYDFVLIFLELPFNDFLYQIYRNIHIVAYLF